MNITRICLVLFAAVGGLQIGNPASALAQSTPPPALLDHGWTWNAEGAAPNPMLELRFSADGLVRSSVGPRWKWRATSPRTITIEGEANRVAVLLFDEAFRSFTATGFDGKTKVRGEAKLAALGEMPPLPKTVVVATPSPPPKPTGIAVAGIDQTRNSVLMATGGHSNELEDMRALLSPYGRPSRDVQPHPEAMIYPGIPYLMQWREVENILVPKNTDMKSGSKIACAGFPDGLSWVAYSGKWTVMNHDYNRLYLVKDIVGQVACIQFGHETESWEKPWPRLPGNWRVIDYVNAEVKGQSGIQIVTQVLDQRKKMHRIVIHTTCPKVGRTSTLFLPEPLVNLMLLCVSGPK